MSIAKLEHKIAAQESKKTGERCDAPVLASKDGRSHPEALSFTRDS